MNLKSLFFWRKEGAPVDDKQALTPEQEKLLDRIAARVVGWRMATPAIMFLESVKPMNYVGSQMMVFFEPFVRAIFNFKEYSIFMEIMQERENVEVLLVKIEKLDLEAYRKEKEEKKKRKEEKKLRKTK
jgi:hypothetical protein